MKVIWFPILRKYIAYTLDYPASHQNINAVPIDVLFVFLACVFYPFKIVRIKK